MGKITHKYYVGDGKLFQAKAFESPQELADAFTEYITWNNDNPWMKHEAIKSGDMAGKIIDIPTERPLTMEGFARYIGLSSRTLRRYGHNSEYIEYRPVYEAIEEHIKKQKFEGAAVGCFNAMIIARDLGLTEKSEIKHDLPKPDNKLEIIVRNANDSKRDKQ